MVDLDDSVLSWDSGLLGIGELGLYVLGDGGVKDVSGEETLVSEDMVILGWDEASITGESWIILSWDKVLVAGVIPGWDKALKAPYQLSGVSLSVVVIVLLLPCRLGFFLLVPGSLALRELVSLLLMCQYAWYVSLVSVCLGVFMGIWSFGDVS